MGRPKKSTLKKYLFDNFYIKVDVYKRTVVSFQIRFDFVRDNNDKIDISSLKKELTNLFENEFGYVKRQRHIFETDLPTTISHHNGRCSLNCFFIKFDDYEDFVIEHSQNLMKEVETLFDRLGIEIVLPTKKE